jgi:hypothetical protein
MKSVKKTWNIGYSKKTDVKASLAIDEKSATATLTISRKGEMKNFDGDPETDDSFDESYYAPWRKYNDDITNIIIENGVTNIGNSAFDGCSNLTAITIPGSVESIGDGFLFSCGHLTAIEVETGNVHYLSENGILYDKERRKLLRYPRGRKGAFIVPDGVTDIDSWAFFGCDNLTSITIPDSVKSIGNRAFVDCCKLTAMTIPNSVTSIDEFAFAGCCNLASLTIPDSVESIGNKAFSGCRNLSAIEVGTGNAHYLAEDGVLYNRERTELLRYPRKKTGSFTIPGSVTSIGHRAFSKCSNLTAVTVPDGITGIDRDAFYKCTGLADINIPDSITSIGDWAFYGCKSLAAITIPDSVESIGDWAFADCEILTAITVPDSVKSIGTDAFKDCNSLITAAIGARSIDAWAFSCCRNLAAVTLSDNVSGIDDEAFSGCRKLMDIKVGTGNPHYLSEDGTLYDKKRKALLRCPCRKQGSFIIPDGVESIGNRAFNECRNLTSVTFPDSVRNIGEEAFSYCSKLTAMTIPDGVKSIGEKAFSDCSKLTAITVSDSVTDIGKWAFSDCDSLVAIEVGTGNAHYRSEDGALYDKERKVLLHYPSGKQGSFIIPDGVESIGDSAFIDCRNLTAITIPDSVRKIDMSIFPDCDLSITMFGATPPDMEIDCTLFLLNYLRRTRKMYTLFVPAGAVKLYRAVDALKKSRIRIRAIE